MRVHDTNVGGEVVKSVAYAGATSAVISAVVTYVFLGAINWTTVGIWTGITVVIASLRAARREN